MAALQYNTTGGTTLAGLDHGPVHFVKMRKISARSPTSCRGCAAHDRRILKLAALYSPQSSPSIASAGWVFLNEKMQSFRSTAAITVMGGLVWTVEGRLPFFPWMPCVKSSASGTEKERHLLPSLIIVSPVAAACKASSTDVSMLWIEHAARRRNEHGGFSRHIRSQRQFV